MAEWRRRYTLAFTCLTVGGAALAGSGSAVADPTDPPPTPVVIYPSDAPAPPPMVSSNPMTPHQPPVPAAAPAPEAPAPAPVDPAAAAPAPADPAAAPAPADPAAPPPAAPVTHPSVPEIPNAHYGSGNGGGGILSSIKDIWHQAQNPFLNPDDLTGGGAPAPPPGAGPAPALPPGYVSTNAPGSETPAAVPAGGSDVGRPALPPGYYPISGPPPPWYTDGTAPAAAVAPAPGS